MSNRMNEWINKNFKKEILINPSNGQNEMVTVATVISCYMLWFCVLQIVHNEHNIKFHASHI